MNAPYVYQYRPSKRETITNTKEQIEDKEKYIEELKKQLSELEEKKTKLEKEMKELEAKGEGPKEMEDCYDENDNFIECPPTKYELKEKELDELNFCNHEYKLDCAIEKLEFMKEHETYEKTTYFGKKQIICESTLRFALRYWDRDE